MLPLALALVALCARADIWGYVDERGVAHFASEKIDDRYQLFLRAAAAPKAAEAVSGAAASGQLPAPAANIDTKVSTSTPATGRGELLSPRLRAFFEQSPAVMRAEPLLRDAAQRFNLDLALLKALVLAESGFDPQAVSPKGAIGLMQLMPATAQRYALQGEPRESLASRLTDPQLNIAIGARHLRELINRYEGRIELALAAYNAGEGAVQRAGDAIPAITETRNYVRQVMQVYEAMRAPFASSVLASAPARAPQPGPGPELVRAASEPARPASAWEAARGGAAARRNMPASAGVPLLPAVAIETGAQPD